MLSLKVLVLSVLSTTPTTSVLTMHAQYFDIDCLLEQVAPRNQSGEDRFEMRELLPNRQLEAQEDTVRKDRVQQQRNLKPKKCDEVEKEAPQKLESRHIRTV